ncbi:MAG: urease accessory protein UreE, partial [Moorea sp. SIO3C2]|nr:urease accessory protein UreE [Moorena sp. SIO3C2]
RPEPVMTAIASTPLSLLKAAYHLGNRHVALEVSLQHLRFTPDPVLKQMVEQMGLTVKDEKVPFHPEQGAYASQTSHDHHGH